MNIKLGKEAVRDIEYGPAGIDVAIVIGEYKLTVGLTILPRQIAIGADVDRAPPAYESGWVEYTAICELFLLGGWAQLERFY